MQVDQSEPQFADLTEERLDRVPMPRDPEPVGQAQQVVDPLGSLAVRHLVGIMARGIRTAKRPRAGKAAGVRLGTLVLCSVSPVGSIVERAHPRRGRHPVPATRRRQCQRQCLAIHVLRVGRLILAPSLAVAGRNDSARAIGLLA